MQRVPQRYDDAVDVHSIAPHELNPNVGANEVIEESLDRHGFYGAVLVQESTRKIIAGKHRWDRAVAKGAESLPVIFLDVDDDQAKRIMEVDNASARAGHDDPRMLVELLESLERGPDGKRDLSGTGVSESDLDALLMQLAPAPVTQSDPDDVPEPPKEPITRLGDLWLLGEHRVLCGDATQQADYDRVLAGEHLVGAVVTDPPYGVAIGAKNRVLDEMDRADRVLTDLEGDRGIKEVEQLWRASFGVLCDVMPGGCPYYVFGPQGGDLGLLLLLLLRDSGLAPRHILIWVKNRPSFSIGRLDYDYQHEPIVYGWRPGGPHSWYAEGTRTSVLNFDRPQASPLHPTAKPVALLTELVSNSTQPGDLVLDPFAGSGSTLIAAHAIGRRARLLEIDPHYVDVTCRRFQEHTGEKPVLERTGEPHDFCEG